MFSGGAYAQSADPRLDALERQIQALQAAHEREMRSLEGEVRALKRSLAARDQQNAAARGGTARPVARSGGGNPALAASATTAPGATSSSAGQAVAANPAVTQIASPYGSVSFPNGRPTFTSADGQLSASIGLQFWYDVGGFFQSGNRPAGAQQLPVWDANLRRARVPITVQDGDVFVKVTPEFGGSPDGIFSLYEANINYTGFRDTLLTAGYYRPSLTLSDATYDEDIMFMERPSIINVARGLAAGQSRASLGGKTWGDQWFLASYLTGPVAGAQEDNEATFAQTGATLRMAGRPIATPDADLHLGFSASDSFRPERYASGQTITLQDWPELHLTSPPSDLISTGPIAARNAYEWGPEFGARWRNLLLQGEYIQIGVDREQTTAVQSQQLNFSGGYLEGSWTLTGEPRLYNPTIAAFDSPIPVHPFSLSQHQWGAFELVGRYSLTDLNDRATAGLPETVTGGVYGGKQQIYSVGLNWYPNDNIRFMLDYDWINVDRLNPSGAQIGQTAQALAMRIQAAY
ncbi:MAG TPA: porin [Roseiarcus sp.]|jgi:phosphate-selective porin OprO/OprP